MKGVPLCLGRLKERQAHWQAAEQEGPHGWWGGHLLDVDSILQMSHICSSISGAEWHWSQRGLQLGKAGLGCRWGL